ncbi:MAG: signal peptidase [Solirubrobacterales bacterium]|nr:signal peptidase [Solirubrobacterales bacterium]
MKKTREKSTTGSLVELVVIVAVALGLALGIQAFLVKPYRIPSESMVPTLTIGQRVLVNRIGNRFSTPKVGEILVFHPPVGAESQTCGAKRRVAGQACDQETPKRADVNFIKRVVAGPGDTLAIVNGHVIRNGRQEKEPFIAPCGQADECNFPKPITIPPDHYFMMGDNRGQSDDSRFWGPDPKKWIIGGAFATYRPPKRIGIF